MSLIMAVPPDPKKKPDAAKNNPATKPPEPAPVAPGSMAAYRPTPSSFNTTVLDAPDQNLRKIYLKAQLNRGALTDKDLNRLAQRQGVEAATLSQRGVVMDPGTGRSLKGQLRPGSYSYLGKPTPSEEFEAAAQTKANDDLRKEQAQREADVKAREKQVYGASTTQGTGTSPDAVSPELPSTDQSTASLVNPSDKLDEMMRGRRSRAFGMLGSTSSIA